jgi:hypothetical protein
MENLLGYVFWHRPRSGTPRRAYEKKLVAFQESLKAHRPDGFIDALSFRVEGRPWSKRRSKGYEDWYLVNDFGSLGVLNEAAVAGSTRSPHDDIAREAAGGAGGIYKQLRGDIPLREARWATWIRKPAKMPYGEFLGEISMLAGERRRVLWRRQMVLGPAQEFCMHSESPLDLGPFKAAKLRVEVVAKASGSPGRRPAPRSDDL